MSAAIGRAIALLRADVAALRREAGADVAWQRVDTGDWRTSGWVVSSRGTAAIFVHDQAPDAEAWCREFARFRNPDAQARSAPSSDQSR